MSIAVPPDMHDKPADPQAAPVPHKPNRLERRAAASIARRKQPRGSRAGSRAKLPNFVRR